MKKPLISIVLLFYILVLLQTSFLAHFSIAGIVPNLALIAVIIINLLERPEDRAGLWSSIVAGFLLDVFSDRPIGPAILVLILFSIFIKLVLKRYVRIPFTKRA